ncbi:hypothetical protein SDC9_53438 [bioreactor metagenome]|uniref:Uncharacterized protein n=1 Tax=bioreactor metagenome TaxID=1076179 RepID=A0A644WTK8_9ZZZZ
MISLYNREKMIVLSIEYTIIFNLSMEKNLNIRVTYL